MRSNAFRRGGGREGFALHGPVKAVFVIVLTVLLYLLARSMQRHHFFDGGEMNKHSQLQLSIHGFDPRGIA